MDFSLKIVACEGFECVRSCSAFCNDEASSILQIHPMIRLLLSGSTYFYI